MDIRYVRRGSSSLYLPYMTYCLLFSSVVKAHTRDYCRRNVDSKRRLPPPFSRTQLFCITRHKLIGCRWAPLNGGVHVIRAVGVVAPVQHVPFRRLPTPVPSIAHEGQAQYRNNRQCSDGPVGRLEDVYRGGRSYGGSSRRHGSYD